MMIKSDYIKISRVLNETAIEMPGENLSFKVHYWGALPEHYDNPVHRHSFFEVCYILQGEGIYSESGIEYPLVPGTLFCSRPGKWHQIKSHTGMEILYVGFEPDSSLSKAEELNRYTKLMTANKIIVKVTNETIAAQTWRLLTNLCLEDRFMSQEMIRSVAYVLLVTFSSEFTEVIELEVNSEYQQISDFYLKRAKLFIEDNLTSSLSLDQLSSYLYISKRHLTRLFLMNIGQSFSHYVQEQRVQRSIVFLLETDWTIQRIAQETGFESVHYYTRVFTQKIGVPPGQFRKSQLSESPFNK